MEYVVKDSHPVEKHSENCLTQICEAYPNGRDYEILSPENSKIEAAHDENYLTDQAHYYSFDEAENDHNNKDHLLNQIGLSDLSKNEIFGTPKNDLSALSRHTDDLASGNKHFSIEEHTTNEKYDEILKNVINEKEKENDSKNDSEQKRKNESNEESEKDEEKEEKEEKEAKEKEDEEKNGKKKNVKILILTHF